jgi:DNA-binding response OmpR family regulator
LTILVADGNTDAAETLALVFRMNGHEVEVAFNGPDALALSLKNRPSAVILNLALPGLDGYEVARRIRDVWPARTPPVLIALTGYGRDEDRKRSRDAGFDHHVLKPANPLELIALIRGGPPSPP